MSQEVQIFLCLALISSAGCSLVLALILFRKTTPSHQRTRASAGATKSTAMTANQVSATRDKPKLKPKAHTDAELAQRELKANRDGAEWA